MNISFYEPYYTGTEINYIKEAMEQHQISGDGHYTEKVVSLLKNKFEILNMVMTTSATHALEMAALLIDLQPGDEVIMPSFSFPSTANAVMLHGGKPVFSEIEEATLNIDIKDVERKISKNTKAIIPVHYGGIACKIDKIMALAETYHLYVIEDAAQGVNAKFKEKHLGTWGHMGCYSFHGTKNYTCGEGGALLLNTNDEQLLYRAEIIRQKGTNRRKFMLGEIDKYSWVDMGSSYTPSDLLMAFLYAQLESMDHITQKRRAIHSYYENFLKRYVDRGIIKMLQTPIDCTPNFHLFTILCRNERERNMLMDNLKKKGITTAFHFVPLHSSTAGQKLGYHQNDLPLTENLSKCLLRLPIYPGMTAEQLAYIQKHLSSCLDGFGEL